MRAEGWAEAEKAKAQRDREPLGEYGRILGRTPRDHNSGTTNYWLASCIRGRVPYSKKSGGVSMNF